MYRSITLTTLVTNWYILFWGRELPIEFLQNLSASMRLLLIHRFEEVLEEQVKHLS